MANNKSSLKPHKKRKKNKLTCLVAGRSTLFLEKSYHFLVSDGGTTVASFFGLARSAIRDLLTVFRLFFVVDDVSIFGLVVDAGTALGSLK